MAASPCERLNNFSSPYSSATSIDVVATLSEVVPVPEATVTVPATVVVTPSEVEPNDADQNAVIPFPAMLMNSGTEPENDHTLKVENAAPSVMHGSELAVAESTVTVQPVPAIPPVDESSEMPLTIAINAPADTTPADMIPPATMKGRKRLKQNGNWVLCSPRKKKSSRKVPGKERSPSARIRRPNIRAGDGVTTYRHKRCT
jgi:hypothetical protein